MAETHANLDDCESGGVNRGLRKTKKAQALSGCAGDRVFRVRVSRRHFSGGILDLFVAGPDWMFSDICPRQVHVAVLPNGPERQPQPRAAAFHSVPEGPCPIFWQLTANG